MTEVVTNEIKKTMINVEDLVEVDIIEDDNFLKIKETLTRIGVASSEKKELYQSCHILHKKGKFYIVHFKELFGLDGKQFSFSEEDKARRNTIVNLLNEWGLVKIIDSNKTKEPLTLLSRIKVLAYKDKKNWKCVPKYNIGSSKKH